jgi:plasmid stability protein
MKLHTRLSALLLGAWFGFGGLVRPDGQGPLAGRADATLGFPVAVAHAQDIAGLIESLTKSDDFRVRVLAAAALGKSREAAARAPLEKALSSDAHPSVRGTAAAALAALGDVKSVEALRVASESDAVPAVRSASASALGKLARKAAAASKSSKAKVLVKLGAMSNKSGVRGVEFEKVLNGATREQAGRLSGVEIVPEGADEQAMAAAKKLPLLVIDGVIRTLSPSSSSSGLIYSAKVEYVIKKQASIKGTVKGAAQAEGSSDIARDDKRLQSLQEAAIVGAIESALRGAPEALALASKLPPV